MAHHAQMTADEWAESVLAEDDSPVVGVLNDGNTIVRIRSHEPDRVYNWNPTTNTAVVPPIPRGSVCAFIKGGVYTATIDQVNAVLDKYHTAKGHSLRRALFERMGAEQEDREFYEDATPFELALVLAWYNNQS